MVLPNAGMISMSNMQAEFSAPAAGGMVVFGNYYAGGPYGVGVAGASNVPTAASNLIRFGQFHLASKVP